MKTKNQVIHILLILFFLIFSISCRIGDGSNRYEEPDEPYVKTDFRDDFTGTEIDSSIWQVATWTEHDGQTGTDRCYVADGYLHLVFIYENENYLSAAIQTWDEFYYGRWEARLKPSSESGVLNSFYTIDWDNTTDTSTNDNGTKQEIDIEFLTYTFADSPGVHFAVHESDRQSFETNPDIELEFDPSADFHIWAINITPEHIQWFVDDQLLCTYTYDGNPITINAPYQLKLNTWTSENWINGPPVAGTECIYQIDWIKFTPY